MAALCQNPVTTTALRWVVCLGREAWQVACGALGVEGDWRTHRNAGEPLGPLVAAFHPEARVERERMAAPWEVLARRVRGARRARAEPRSSSYESRLYPAFTADAGTGIGVKSGMARLLSPDFRAPS